MQLWAFGSFLPSFFSLSVSAWHRSDGFGAPVLMSPPLCPGECLFRPYMHRQEGLPTNKKRITITLILLMYYACPVSIPDNERKKKKLDLTEDGLFFLSRAAITV